MKRKISFSVIAIVCISILVFGVSAFAFASSSSQTVSASAAGTFKALSADKSEMTITTDKGDQTIAIAQSIWIYRNEAKGALTDLQPGDRVEVILNSKNQAAYIKAAAAGTAPAEPNAGAAPTPTPSAAVPTPTPSAQAPAGVKIPVPLAKANVQSADAMAVYPGLDSIHLKISGAHFKLELMRNPGNDGTKLEFSIKPDHGGMIHLKGAEAATWIGELLGQVDLKAPDAEQKLLQEIAGQYALDASKLHILLNTQWAKMQDGEQPNAVLQDNSGKKAADEHDSIKAEDSEEHGATAKVTGEQGAVKVEDGEEHDEAEHDVTAKAAVEHSVKSEDNAEHAVKAESKHQHGGKHEKKADDR